MSLRDAARLGAQTLVSLAALYAAAWIAEALDPTPSDSAATPPHLSTER